MHTQTPTPGRPARQLPSDGAVNPWLRWSVETPTERQVLSVAELAECRCPDLCDRDHANE
ncbi:MAG: hypothetical protein H0W17_07425 [Chloroflexi bacterium]|nr:hypothetical protein [Chloroflexota bacterium]